MTTVAIDLFAGSKPGVGTAAENIAAVTPDDANDLAATCRWIMFGTDGATHKLTITDRKGTKTTIIGLLPGVFYPIMANRIWNTNTDVTNIFVGW